MSSFLVSSNEILIGTTNSGISYQLREIYSIFRCCWNVATYKWKVHNGKIEIISFCGKYVIYTLIQLILYVSRRLNILCIKFKIIASSYMLGLAFYSHLENSCIITSLYVWPIKLENQFNPTTSYLSVCTKPGK